MKFSSVALIGALVGLSTANYVQTTDIEVDVVCTDASPSTVTTTVTSIVTQMVTVGAPPATSVDDSWVETVGDSVTSCNYQGSKTTVYVWQTGSASQDITVVVYEQWTVIEVSVINIDVTVTNGQTVTKTVTKETHPTYTPPPPPPPPHKTKSHTTKATTTTPAKQTHTVQVGALGELIFGPNQLDAAVGDIVRFDFLKLNHSVTQSTFAHPCTYNGRFDTGLNQFNPKNISGKFLVDFQVNTTEPLWFYWLVNCSFILTIPYTCLTHCSKQSFPASHCHKGMVLGINPKDKFAAFLANAESEGGNSSVPTRHAAIKRDRAVSWLA